MPNDKNDIRMILRFGGNVRKIRNQLGWSQKKLAEKTGLAVTFICFIENGQRGTKLNSIVRIQKALGCELNDLFEETKTPKLKRITAGNPNTLEDRQITRMLSAKNQPVYSLNQA